MVSAPVVTLPGTGAPGQPVYLDLEPDPVLAFLHLPPDDAGHDTAVLICPPFGWDEMSSYRGRLRWAGALAEAGYPAARIDLPGTGDSAGMPKDPNRLEAWTGAVGGAAAWLRERTGCRRLVAIGIGVGGVLAYRAAADGAPIDDLILWAVPASGRVLLRELRAHAAMIAARNPADARPEAVPDGALELTGYLLDAATASALEAIRLTDLQLPRADQRRILLLGRDGINPDKRLREHLAQAGADVAIADEGDYAMLMAYPQEAKTPLDTIAASIAWLDGAGTNGSTGAGEPSLVERESAEFSSAGHAIRETALRFEVPGGQVFGVLTEPVSDRQAPYTAVLLNAGALRHIGPNRTWVELARGWAARGIPTLRADLQGIGEASGDERELVADPPMYAPHTIEQTLALIAALAARGLPDRFVLGGLCSGAYWSLHAALADPRVRGILMINLYSFHWSHELVEERQTYASVGAIKGWGWRRLVRGDIKLRHVKLLFGRLRPSRIRAGRGHPVERAQREQIKQALDVLRDQGTSVSLLLGQGEPLYGQLERLRLLDEAGRWPNLTIEQLPSRDHMFRALWLQEYVKSRLDAALDRVTETAQ